MEDKNYYDILGVSEKASLEDITAAKNELAKRFHPDVNIKDGIDTTEKMHIRGVPHPVQPGQTFRIRLEPQAQTSRHADL